MLEVKSLNKSFLGREVLTRLSASFAEGIVHVILGPNGAGKTVLLKIISGVYSQDKGHMYLDGREFVPYSPRDAIKFGIAYIPQIPYLPENFNVRQVNRLLGSFSEKYMTMKLLEVGDETEISTLSLVELQILECQIALARKPKVILLDEPRFASMAEYLDIWKLFLGACRSMGIVVLIVLHDYEVASREGDVVIFLENGKIKRRLGPEVSIQEKLALARQYFGTQGESLQISKHDNQSSETFLKVELSRARELKLHTNRVNCIFCALSTTWYSDIEDVINSLKTLPLTRGNLGILPSHRADRGLALECSLMENLILSSINVKIGSLLLRRHLKDEMQEIISTLERFDIWPRKLDEKVANLSGGNKQRLAYARLFLQRKTFQLYVNPWRGLDRRGIQMASNHIAQEYDAGSTIIVITDSLEEAKFFAVQDGKFTILRSGGIQSDYAIAN